MLPSCMQNYHLSDSVSKELKMSKFHSSRIYGRAVVLDYIRLRKCLQMKTQRGIIKAGFYHSAIMAAIQQRLKQTGQGKTTTRTVKSSSGKVI